MVVEVVVLVVVARVVVVVEDTVAGLFVACVDLVNPAGLIRDTV